MKFLEIADKLGAKVYKLAKEITKKSVGKERKVNRTGT